MEALVLSTETPPVHPVLGCARSMAAALDEIAEVNPAFMSTTEKREALLELGRVAARVDGTRLALLAIADDVAELTAARSAGEWAAHELKLDPREGRRDQAIASALDARYPVLGEALRAGRAQRAQAEVIVKALDLLPGDLPAETLELAEKHLLGEAAHHTPGRLRTLGKKLLEVIDPALAEALEKKLLDDADERAAATTKVTFRPRGDGTTDLHARVPDHIATRLKAYLDAWLNPKRPKAATKTEPTPDAEAEPEAEPAVQVPDGPEPTAPDDKRPYTRRLGDAFCRLLESYDPTRLPIHGGDATTLVITIDHERLKTATGAATLPDGTPLSPAQLRRLACTSGILPMVLNGDGQPVDLG